MRIIALLLTLWILTPAAFAKPLNPAAKRKAAAVKLAPGFNGADLERIKVGNQAGLLKIMSPNRATTVFKKSSIDSDVEAIDGVKWAPVTPTHRDAVLAGLNVTNSESLTVSLLKNYSSLPHTESVVLLGVLATPGNLSTGLSAPTRTRVLAFLRDRLRLPDDNPTRRQAVLALAIQPDFQTESLNAILAFMKRDHNFWDTFTTVQFFEYHRKEIVALANLEKIKNEITASGNPHTQHALRALDPPTPEDPSSSPSAKPPTP